MNAWRDAWFDFEDAAYLNAAAQGPMPRVAIRAVQQALEWKKFPHRIPDDIYFALPDRVRASLAKILGAQASDIAITDGHFERHWPQSPPAWSGNPTTKC